MDVCPRRRRAEKSPLLAARREFAEELGIAAPAAELIDLGAGAPGGRHCARTVTAWAVPGGVDPQEVIPGIFEMPWPKGPGITRTSLEIDRVAGFSLDAARRKLVEAGARASTGWPRACPSTSPDPWLARDRCARQPNPAGGVPAGAEPRACTPGWGVQGLPGWHETRTATRHWAPRSTGGTA